MELTFFAIPVILAGLFTPGNKILSAFLICFLFGGTATLSLPALGGAPVLPAVLMLPFILWKAVNEKSAGAAIQDFAYPSAGFWLMLLVLYEIFSAYALPRLFEGDIFVYMANRGEVRGVKLLPLKPVSTNLTQSIYAVFGLMTFFAAYILLDSQKRLQEFMYGVLLVALLNILAALMQLGESYLGLPSLLAVVRNAEYYIFGSYEVGGLIRIQGTFPEASGFSGFTLPIFAFSFILFRDNVVPLFSGGVALATLSLLLLSTSSASYFSLAVYLGCILLLSIGGFFWNRTPIRLGKIFWFSWSVLVVFCCLFLVKPEILTRIIDFFDLTLFKKLESGSGIERSAWNWQGLTNFIDSYGIGVGFGSNRSSNIFVALLSNVGVIGACLFAAFLWQIASARSEKLLPAEIAIITAAKHALLISLISSFVAAPYADPGMMFFLFAAAAAFASRKDLDVLRYSNGHPS